MTTTQTIPTPGHPWPEQGGVYIGIAPAEAGLPMRHVVALDVTPPAEIMNWHEAMAWAASLGNGARLPTRIEAVMAYQNARDAFERSNWYWAGTQDSHNDAFVQDFANGGSRWGYKDVQRRVRAFRGLTLDTLTPLPGDATAAPAGANFDEVAQ